MKYFVGLPVVNGFLMVELGNFKDTLKNGLLRSLNGRLTGVHKVLYSAEIACKGRQDFYLGHDGGYMILIHIKIGQGIRTHFEKLVFGMERTNSFLSISKTTFSIST